MFVKRILSISVNSASCERLFSLFRNILTKLRSRLHVQRIIDIAEISMHVRDEHTQQNSSTQERLKKLFSDSGAQDSNISNAGKTSILIVTIHLYGSTR